MTMIYDPISFVILVQIFLVGNYEPIMRMCGKIFIINLQTLQMLFMLWIKNKFSECLAPCTNMKVPNGRLSGDGSAQALSNGGIRGQLPPNLFCAPQIVLCWEKFVSNIW